MELRTFNFSCSLLFFILAIILFFKKSPNKKPNIFLGVLFVLMATYCELIFFHFKWVVNQETLYLSHYLPVDGIILLLMSPCLYFFVLSLIDKPFQIIKWKSLLHLLPVLPCLIFNIMFSTWPVDQRIEWFNRDLDKGNIEMNILNIILYLQIIAYLFVCLYLVSNQLKLSRYVQRNGFKTDISWIRLFLIFNIAFMLISAPFCFMGANERTNIYIGLLAMNIELIFLLVMTILKTDIIGSEKIDPKKTGYKIQENQADEYWNTLTTYMEVHKPYLKEDCNLRTLAHHLNIPEHHLTNTLNAHIGESFADFTNKYRVAEAKIHLQDKSIDAKNVDEIAFKCGFGSRSSFYRIFKKITTLTPIEYRKQYLENLENS